MARREVNVFSLSFLDLLSGALGAVLILYVIVPKMTSEVQAQVEELEEIHRMNVTVQSIDSILVALQASVPAEALAPLQEQIETLQGAVTDLRTAVNGLQLDLQNCQTNLQQCEADREALQGQIESLQSQVTEVEQQLEACEVNRSTLAGELQTCQAALARTFLVVYITWPTRGDDVRLIRSNPQVELRDAEKGRMRAEDDGACGG